MMKSRKMVNSLVVVPVPGNSKQAISRNVVVVQNSKSRRKRKKKISVPRGLGGSLSQAYLQCLMDPFNFPPVKAGYGTMVPTQIHTAYVRTALTTSTGGNLSIFVLPNQNNLVMYTAPSVVTSNATGANSGLIASANASIINGMMDESRTLAMGLRLIPMIPATSVPGIISMGCSPRSDLADFVAPTAAINYTSYSGIANASTQTVNQLPYLREHMGRPGGVDYFQTTWRPTDNKDFEFSVGDLPLIGFQNSSSFAPFYDINSNSTSGSTLARSDDTQGSFLVATLQGLPSNTVVYIEVILHLECTNSSNTSNLTDCFDSRNSSDTVAAEGPFSTYESFYRSISDRLPSVDTVVAAASSVMTSPMARNLANRYVNRVLGVQSTGYRTITQL